MDGEDRNAAEEKDVASPSRYDVTGAEGTTDLSKGHVSLVLSAARWPSMTSFQRKEEGQ